MNKLVSIIIPAYNVEHLLGETLDSVLKTAYSPIEVIVVNDGSQDNTLALIQSYVAKDDRIRVINQSNQGVCRSRNNAIIQAKGKYILPVDADNLIEPNFVPEAVAILEARPEVKVVQPSADFFGDKTGKWDLPPFSLHLLARKNIMDTCAMYRKEDWQRIGGYCEEIIAREDWEFWISMLKDGGEVVRLPEIVFHYRVQKNSKRIADRKYNYFAIQVLNKRHPEFFKRELGGPLRRMRSWSRFINFFANLF